MGADELLFAECCEVLGMVIWQNLSSESAYRSGLCYGIRMPGDLDSPTTDTLISIDDLDLSRLLPVELTTEGAGNVKQIDCETRKREQA